MTQSPTPHRPLRLFISYAAADDALAEKVQVCLVPLVQQGLIETWHRSRMLPGDSKSATVSQKLEESDVIAPLLSADYFASDEIYRDEMQRALARHQRGALRVVPILLRPTDLSATPFADLVLLPRDGQPITPRRSVDKALLDVSQGLQRVVKEWWPEAAQHVAIASDRRAEAESKRLVARSLARSLGGGPDVATVYLTSELFQQTAPIDIALSAPAALLLDGVVSAWKLPLALDHAGRVGVRFTYTLQLGRRGLSRDRTLAAQGVKPGAVLWLKTRMDPHAATDPQRAGRPSTYRIDPRSPDDPEALLAALGPALLAAGLRDET